MINKPMLSLAAAIAAAMSLMSGCTAYKEANNDIKHTNEVATDLEHLL